MIMDGLLLFSSAQAVTSSADSTNVIDLSTFRDMGIGDPALKLVVLCTTTALSTASSTIQVLLRGSTDNSTYTTMWSSPAYAKATVTAGTRLADIDIPRPVAGQAVPRYLKLNYTIATADLTAGAFTAGIVLDRGDQVSYPAGITVAN